MKRQEIIIGILAVSLIMIWNSWQFLESKNWNALSNNAFLDPSKNMAKASEPKLWQDIKKTSLAETSDGVFEPMFDESVSSANGTRVKLPGVGFLLSSGRHYNEIGEEEVTEFLLLPADGGVAWCCGLKPIARFEYSVLVECADASFLASETDAKSAAIFVSVEGILRLQKDNSINSLYTLEDVEIEFISLEDVAPPNVTNLCRNQPLFP